MAYTGEKNAEYKREWRKRNPEKYAEYLARTREKRAADPEPHRARSRQWQAENRERARRVQRERRVTLEGRAHGLYHTARYSAAKRNIPFDLTKEWIAAKLEAGICEATGLPLVLENGDRQPWAPSLDRTVPALGYTQANVRIVCWAYNAAKGTWTDADVLTMAKAIVAKNTA